MKLIYGNIWELYTAYDALVITTNGTIKSNGEAVMGRGIARQAAQKYPTLPRILGTKLRTHGNNVQRLAIIDTRITLLSYPVKHHWHQDADFTLIERSAEQLVKYADKYNWNTIILPRPGCGNGHRDWDAVNPLISQVLDDRFHICTYKEK